MLSYPGLVIGILSLAILAGVLSFPAAAQSSVPLPSAWISVYTHKAHDLTRYRFFESGKIISRRYNEPPVEQMFIVEGIKERSRNGVRITNTRGLWNISIENTSRLAIVNISAEGKISYRPYNKTVVRMTSISQDIRVIVFYAFDDISPVTIKYRIENNGRENITNFRFHYLYTIPLGVRESYHAGEDNVIVAGNSLDPGNSEVRVGSIHFGFYDLLRTGLSIDHIFVGEGTILGLANGRVFDLVTTIPSGIIEPGSAFVFDPIQSPGYSPANATTQNWTTISNIYTSNNARAQSSAVNSSFRAKNFSIDLSSSAEIVGIQICLEANICGTRCSPPPE